MSKQNYTLREVAAIFRVSTKTMRLILKRHPYCAHVGRKIIVSAEDVDRLYDAMKAPIKTPEVFHPTPSEARIYAQLSKRRQSAKKLKPHTR